MTVHERLRRLRRFFECLTSGSTSVAVTCDYEKFMVRAVLPIDWTAFAVPGIVYRFDDHWCATLGVHTNLEDALRLAESMMADCVEIFLKRKVDPDQLRDLLRILACNAPIVSEDVAPDAPLSIRSQ